MGAVRREASLVTEAGRLAWSRLGAKVGRGLGVRAPYAEPVTPHDVDPVVLVSGFMAGDLSLVPLARALRERGHRTYLSGIHANVGCTARAVAQLESRLEWVAARRGGRVRIVGPAGVDCSPAGSSYAGRTWSPESSPSEAPCSLRAHTTSP
jgi:hypothetical protein